MNTNKDKKLELLMALQANPFPTPDWLLEKFQIDLETLSDWMRSIDDLNITIDNYQWQTTFEPIDLDTLEQILCWECLDIEYKMTIPSTHLYLKNLKKPAKNPILCLAEHQSGGLGQRQKAWASPFGHNLYFSLNIITKRRPQDLSGLSLCIALSILKALNIPTLNIKWPNDIYAEDQKLAGILIDLGQYQHDGMPLIISIGLNVNQMQSFGLENQWTSLQKVMDKIQNRTLILAQILQQLKLDMAVFEAKGFHAFRQEWHKFDALFEKEVLVTQGDKIIYGRALGVDEMGRMLLEVESKIIHLNFGEASIKPQR